MSNKQELIVLAASLTAEPARPFQVGDVVVWKDGLSNKKRPAYGEEVVVTQVIEGVYGAERDDGHPYFREPLTLTIGMTDSDDDFVEYHVDGRRFRHAD